MPVQMNMLVYTYCKCLTKIDLFYFEHLQEINEYLHTFVHVPYVIQYTHGEACVNIPQ